MRATRTDILVFKLEREVCRDMNVRRIPFKPALIKRKDNLITFDLPRASLGGRRFRTLHEVATCVINDDGAWQLIDSDVVPRRRRLTAFKLCRKSSVELRSRRYGSITQRLIMVLIGIQLDLNRCRIAVDLNRRRRRHILGAHGGCAVKYCGGEANQNENQSRHTQRP